MEYLEGSAKDEQIVKMPRTEVYLKGVQHGVDVPYRYIELDKSASKQLHTVVTGTVQRDGSG
jgi:hypothetical protein